jgi:glycosyltransferase involved in cell wall biosynthesis
MNKLLSICIPCYNKSKHFHGLIEQLQPLSDIAEVCVFDNGSTDGLGAVVSECGQGITIRYHRVEPVGSIDYGWLGAINMARCPYVKLQLGDDVPNAANIRDGLMQLVNAPNKDFILSKCSVKDSIGDDIPSGYKVGYFQRADRLREAISKLKNPKERAEFVFTELSTNNRMGDINGLIFRSDSLDGISALRQSYYNFHTHPDSEIFLYLISNHAGLFFDRPFSSWTVSPESPQTMRESNQDFGLKVYTLPDAIHALLLFIDPAFSAIRKDVGVVLYWKTLLVYCARLCKTANHIRKIRRKLL